MKRSKTQWKRLLVLNDRIKAGKYPNCSSFAKEWEVSPRPIQRDVEFLHTSWALRLNTMP